MPAPDQWTETTIGEVTLSIDKHRPEEEPSKHFHYVDISSIDNSCNRVVEPKLVLGRDAPSRARQSVSAGDTVLSTVRTYLKNTAIIPAALDGATASTGFSVLRPDPDRIDSRFLFYRVLEESFVRELSEKQTGTSYPAVRDRDVRAMAFSYPTLIEQQQIAEAIEEQFSRLDAGVDSLQRAKRNLTRLRASILQAGVDGRLTASGTDSWDARKIGQMGQVGSGATPRRGNPDYWVGGAVPWVTSGQLNASLVTEPADYITERAVEETSVRLWPAGTILVAMYGEGKTRGKCSELTFPSTTNQACAAILLDEEHAHVKPFLKLFLTARYEENRRLASGGVQPNLSLGLIKSVEVPVPPAAEQDQIVSEVERLLSVVNSVEATVEIGLIRSEPLRQSILSDAFSGRLTPSVREVA